MNRRNKWVVGLAALVLTIGLMAGCSSGSNSPANVNPLEGDAVPSGNTVPSEGAGAGAGADLSTKAGDAVKDSGQTDK